MTDQNAQPWRDEPDSLDFEAHGLPCAMRRGPRGHWCGYVGVPKQHPFFGASTYAFGEFDARHWSDDIRVHGGLTYEANRLPDANGASEFWWYGFDCHHAGDIAPTSNATHESGAVYRDVHYVRRECESLAKQLAQLDNYRRWFEPVRMSGEHDDG